MAKQAKTIEQRFESFLWNSRFIIILIVLAILLSSLVAIGLGFVSIGSAIKEFAYGLQNGKVNSNIIIVYIISSLDEFLLGIVLIIFALGIYELFISKIDAIDTRKDLPYPHWLTFTNMEELKSVLTKVLIIILMVFFFKSVVLLNFSTPLDTLYLAIGILLIALANFLAKVPKKK